MRFERLDPASAVLLIVDVQQRFEPAMPTKVFSSLLRNTATLVDAARRFDIPVVASRQYPKGLGPICAPVEEALAQLPETQVHRFDKVEFSVCDSEHFPAVWEQLRGRDNWIVCGMECHICVYQSVRALRARRVHAQVVADAVCSRSKQNWQLGLDLMRGLDAAISSTETVVFDVVRQAGSDDFKALSKRIR